MLSSRCCAVRLRKPPLMVIPFVAGLCGLSLAIWLGLTFARGGFWKSDQRLEPAGERADWPEVVAVIPARNEAPTIGRTVASLLGQDYTGQLQVIVVDDNSDDGTAEAARDAVGQSERLHIVQGKPLEAGWSGELWAVQQGIEAVSRRISGVGRRPQPAQTPFHRRGRAGRRAPSSGSGTARCGRTPPASRPQLGNRC